MSVLFKFKQLNRSATINNVKAFFRSDLPELENISGLPISSALNSPELDVSSIATTNINHYENIMIRSVDAKRELSIIADTIKELKSTNADSFKVLSSLILEHESDTSCITTNSYSSSLFYHRIKPQAMIDFAYQYATHGHDLLIFDTD